MSSSQFSTPIFLFAPQYHRGPLYAVHPDTIEENISRLREVGVGRERIHTVPHSSTLKTMIENVRNGQNACLILPGGYTPFLSQELNGAGAAIRCAVIEKRLKVLGQCAGANMLCSDMAPIPKHPEDRNRNSELKLLNLLPLRANTEVYPIAKGHPSGDLANRRVVPIQLHGGSEFNSFWYRGAKFEPALPSKFHPNLRVFAMAYYNDIKEAPVAAVYAQHFDGTTAIVATQYHPEVVQVDVLPERESSREQLAQDNGRINHMRDIYTVLGIIPPCELGLQKDFHFTRPISSRLSSLKTELEPSPILKLATSKICYAPPFAKVKNPRSLFEPFTGRFRGAPYRESCLFRTRWCLKIR